MRGSSAEGGDEVENKTSDFRRQTLDDEASNFAETFGSLLRELSAKLTEGLVKTNILVFLLLFYEKYKFTHLKSKV